VMRAWAGLVNPTWLIVLQVASIHEKNYIDKVAVWGRMGQYIGFVLPRSAKS